MIRAPRTATAPCPAGCICRTCSDALTRWLNDLPARDGAKREPWGGNQRRVPGWPTEGRNA